MMKTINERIFELHLEGEYTWQEVADMVNAEYGEQLSANACRKRVGRMNEPSEVVRPFDFNSTTTPPYTLATTTGNDFEMTPYEQFLADSGMDLNEFQVKAGSVWGAGNNLNFSAKWERKPASYEEMFNALSRAFMGQYVGDVQEPSFWRPLLAVIGMSDAHIGKLAFDEGIDPYEMYFKVIQYFAAEIKTRNYPVEKIIYVVGNDLRHFDNPHYTTTQGTQLEPSLHWTKSIDKTIEILRWSIEYLAENVAPVDVHVVQGNHDQESMYWTGHVLNAYFSKSEGINIFNPKSGRQYTKWGNLGIMMLHGADEKKNDFGWTFASENPKLWGETDTHIALSGHLHAMEISEKNGFMTYQFPALSQTDEWHYRKTFTGNKRGGLMLLFNSSGSLHTMIPGYYL